MTTAIDSSLPYLATIFTGLGVIFYYLRRAHTESVSELESKIDKLTKRLDEQDARHSAQVHLMNQRAEERDRHIDRLERALTAARLYIAELRGILADMGRPTREPDFDLDHPDPAPPSARLEP